MITLFNEDSASDESEVFSVPVGSYVILSGFHFSGEPVTIDPDKQKETPMAIVQKLVFLDGNIPDGLSCEEFKSLSDVEVPYTYKEDVTQCGLWNLSACQNLVILSVPGTYMLKLNDPNSVGTVIVVADRYFKDEVGYLPRDLFLGEM